MTAWWEIDTPQLLGAVPKFRAVASPCFSNRPIRCLVGELRQPVKVPNRRPHTRSSSGNTSSRPTAKIRNICAGRRAAFESRGPFRPAGSLQCVVIPLAGTGGQTATSQ